LKRGQPFRFSKRLYKLRWRIESAFNRLKDFRRIATRYDRLARNYLSSVCLAAALVWWTLMSLDPNCRQVREVALRSTGERIKCRYPGSGNIRDVPSDQR